jgi:lipoate synthase
MRLDTQNKVASSILVEKSPVHAPEPEEPVRTAEALAEMALGFCVVTRVTRDDLPDRGPWHILCILYLPGLG